MNIDLIGANEKGLSISLNNQESQNCYVMATPRGRGPVALVGSPGSAVFSPTSGEMRGCDECKGISYWVIGNSLYSADVNGVATSLGTVPGTGRIDITHDGVSLIIVNGTSTAYFYNTVTATFTPVAMPYVAYTVDMLDTYAVFSSDGQRWFISNVGDTDNVSALDFALAAKQPDDLLAIVEDHSELILFGAKVTEPWFNSSGIDFPFAQNTAGVMERGAYTRWGIVKDDNTLVFLGDDLIVYRLQGYTPTRVSNDSLETQLSDLLDDGFESDLRNAFAIIYTDHGHKFYQLTIPNHATLVLDLATGEWHSKKHWKYATHHAVCYVKCYGKHLIGGLDGKIYQMSRNFYDDAGEVLKFLRRSHAYSADDKLIHWKEIKFLFDYGSTPLTSGQGSNPQMVLHWSDDYGRTWSTPKFLPLGKQGQYLEKAVQRGMGRSRNRLFEYYITDPVPRNFSGATAVAS